jgi:hypothetical protein
VDVDERGRHRRSLTVAMSAWSASQLGGWIRREAETEETGVGLRDAVRSALSGAKLPIRT